MSGSWGRCFEGVRRIWGSGLVLGIAAVLAACGGSPPAPGACGSGYVDCGGTCVSLESDPANCGTCGAACDSGQVCAAGQCATECAPGQDTCDGACADLASDHDHCGACGNACDSEQACVNGACVLDCPSGYDICDGACVNLRSSWAHCGRCGMICSGNQVCANGACAYDCPSGQLACGGVCIDPGANKDHCGAAGDCTGDYAGQACREDQVCSAGSCVCPAGYVECNGTCIDPAVNRDYCGATDCAGGSAGQECRDDQTCATGSCVCVETGYIECGGACVDPKTDLTYCGATDCASGDTDGVACNGNETCYEGVCYLDVTYVGALGPTTGRWNFGDQLGINGANIACQALVENDDAHVCTRAELQAASDLGRLAGETDVSSFWIQDPGADSVNQCLGWTYGTSHNADSLFANLADGSLGQVTSDDSCGGARHIACCVTPSN